MNCSPGLIRILFITVSYLLCTCSFSHAQQLLKKTVTVNVKRQPLIQVLNEISQQGKFYFSYTSDAVRNDSLVTLAAPDKTVKQVLDLLFGSSRQYREVGDHIIIQRIAADPSRMFTVSGYIKDTESGMRIVNATVYERQQFISTLTNDQGFFRLRLKGSDRYPAAITISKDLYRDTTLTVHAGYDQEVAVSIKPATPVMLAPVDIGVEKTWIGKFFLSSKQRMQSLNLTRFLADKPFQTSLVPGLGTHGKLDAQVINKFSANVVGGYAAGLNGFEMGSIFNIDRKDVQYVQVAGVFNVVGGQVKGFQAAGVHNYVLDTVKGVQAAGVLNIVKGRVRGVQAAGVFNQVQDSLQGVQGLQAAGVFNTVKGPVKGVQAAGVFNRTKNNVQGLQAAGVGNMSNREMNGLQAAGVFNYAKKMNGVQIGVVNIADTSSGYSIGLLNIIKKGGYHKLSLSANEVTLLNLSLKTGNRKLYSILTAGLNPVHDKKAFAFGLGIGKEFSFTEKLSLTTEFISQNLYLGDWERLPSLIRLQPALNFKLGKLCTLFAGPVLSIYSPQQTEPKTGYRSDVPTVGWNLGVSIF